MDAYANHTKQQLAAGRIAIGMGLYQARTIDIAAVSKTAGFDWLFIDMEHAALDMGTAAQIAAAALPLGITPIVRVPGKEHHHASRLLDAGAQGIVVPHVQSVEEAQLAVQYCKYPPEGHRSVMGVQPGFQFDKVPVADITRILNEQTLVIIMLETPEAIAKVEAIASVQGVDVIMIGTNDLCAEMGIPGQYGNPKIEEAYKQVIASCRKHGKFPGMGGVGEPPLMERYIRLGMRFILSGNDINFLLSGARERANFLHGIDV